MRVMGASPAVAAAPPSATGGDDGTSRRRPRRARRLALLGLLLIGLACSTVIQSFSWNQTSHYDLVRALNEDTTHIDRYRANTGDKVLYHGHWYSARAPGLALFVLPFYYTLTQVGAEEWTREHVAPPDHPGDEMIYLVGMWGSVLPGMLLLLLVYGVGERFAPGYGALPAAALGLGTMVLPLSTLLFSHVFTAFLGFAAFWLALREREGPPSVSLLGLAGLASGYAVGAEYPLLIVAVIVGLYVLARRDTLSVWGILRRGGAYLAGGIVGIVPLLLYNHYAFHSLTHLAYSEVERQQKGFFGIGAPSLRVLITLLLDSRGLLTLSPVLLMGAIGTVLLYRGGRRAEAAVIAAVCVCYPLYNSGYYLPFGGGFMGPRFLATLLPFLACPVGVALRRFPGPTIALAGASVAATAIGAATHPLVGYETETARWWHLLEAGTFQPTIASAYGLGRGWGGIWVFLLPALGGLALAVAATSRLRLDARALGAGIAALGAWALFAALAPTALGIDHQGLLDILHAGDKTALEYGPHTRHPAFSTYPLRVLAPVAAGFGAVLLAAMALLRSVRARPPRAPRRIAFARRRGALSSASS